MEELLEQANEIQEALGRSYAVPGEIDEADLQAGKLMIDIMYFCELLKGFAELEALELDQDEGASYLEDALSNKAPDYIDEEPLDAGEVSTESPFRVVPSSF